MSVDIFRKGLYGSMESTDVDRTLRTGRARHRVTGLGDCLEATRHLRGGMWRCRVMTGRQIHIYIAARARRRCFLLQPRACRTRKSVNS